MMPQSHFRPRGPSALLSFAVALGLALATACSNDDAVEETPSPAGTCTSPPSTDLPPPSADPKASAHLRIFNFVGPAMETAALDVCVQSKTGGDAAPWIGPVFRNTHTFPKYGNVSPYFDVPAGAYRFRFVVWGSAECEATMTSLEKDGDIESEFAAGSYWTVTPASWFLDGASGLASQPFTIRAFEDKSDYGARELSVRFLHMDPSIPGLDVWKAAKDSDPATWELVMDNVPFGEVGKAPTTSPWGETDARGYLHQTPKDWPVALLFNTAMCPHGSKTNCFLVGSQTLEGNVTMFTMKSEAIWKYVFISDGAKLYDENQPRMTRSDEWW